MTPLTMDLPEQLEGEETAAAETNGHAATDPLVLEAALDEVGKELAGGAAGDATASDDAEASSGIADTATAKPKKTADEKAADKATKHYEKRKREAEENLSQCVLHRRECEAATKSAKASEKAAAELLEHVLARGVEQLPLFDKPDTAVGGNEVADVAAASPTNNPDPDAWKSVPISELGLHPSLAEKLASDGMDTIGRLEQRRADISNGREKWPKGIGKAKITLDMDAVVGWLTENQHVAGQTEPEPTDAELDQMLIDRAKAINTGDAGCLDHVCATDEKFLSGQQAHGRKLKLTDCPYEAGDEQDDWLRGWTYAAELERGETISSDLGDM